MARRVAALACLALAGCATQLTAEGERVRLVTAAQKPACTFVKVVTAEARLGHDKPGSALKEALNEAGAAGANGFYIATSAMDAFEGASVTGEALRCP